MSARTEESRVLFDQLYNCAQSTFAVFAEDYGVSKEQAFMLGSSFGSGARCGNLCGACTGALMTIGLAKGNTVGDDREQKDIAKADVLEFLRRFEESNGSLVCKDLLGPNGQSDGYRKTCVEYVADAIRILEEMGY